MKLLLNLLIAFCLLGLNPAQAADQNHADELYSTGQQAFNDGFHDLAIRYLEDFTSQFPNDPNMPQAKLLLGQCYFLKNNFEKAQVIFKSISDIKDNRDAWLYWWAEANLKLSKLTQAQQGYQEIILDFPDSSYLPQAMYSLAWLYFDQKQFDKAMDLFSSLVTKFPNNQLAEDGLLKIGESAYNAGHYVQAIQVFNKYLDLYPDSEQAAQVRLYIADAYYYKDDFIPALNAYEKIIKSSADPAMIQAGYNGKIWSAIKKRMYDTAQRTIKEALEFSKQKKLPIQDILLTGANLYYEQGDMEGAVKAYSEFIKMFPSGSERQEVYLGRANAYFALNKFDEAADDFKFVIDHHQPQANQSILMKATLGLGWSKSKLGELPQAVKQFETAFELSADIDGKANALAQLADVYHDANQLPQAIELYNRILKEYPQSAYTDYVQYRIGVVMLKDEKFDEALSFFNQLMTSFPQSKYLEDVHYYMGVISFKQGDWNKSIDAMEGFLKGLTQPSEFAPQANYILGLSYLNLKKTEEALKIFQKILRLYPDQINVASNADLGIAKCQYELGQVKDAVKRFKLIVYKYPNKPIEQEALLWLAQYSMKTSDFISAIEYYKQIIDHFPGSPQMDAIHYELAQAYEAQSIPDQALVHYKAVTNKDKALYSKVKLAIAGILSKDFDPQRAIGVYENIIQSNPEYAREAYMKMGTIYRNAQNFEKEVQIYERALKTEPTKGSVTNAELMFNIADAYEVMGRREEAVDAYIKIASQYADQTVWVVKAYLRVAKIFEDDKNIEGARLTYQKIVQLNTEESKYAQERLELLRKK